MFFFPIQKLKFNLDLKNIYITIIILLLQSTLNNTAVILLLKINDNNK